MDENEEEGDEGVGANESMGVEEMDEPLLKPKQKKVLIFLKFIFLHVKCKLSHFASNCRSVIHLLLTF